MKSNSASQRLIHSRIVTLTTALALIVFAYVLTGCGGVPTPEPETEAPDWFDLELTDVQTGQTFTMNDYDGKVVLLETMAIWCPNCIVQAQEVRNLHELVDNPDDLISVSLDVDVNETAQSLKEYSEEFGFEWHFAIAPLEVARALGNLYSAQYLNPPLSPMLIIDRDGGVHQLEYGRKNAESLLESIQPYLQAE